MRIHAHIERTLRLKTESPAGIVKLHRTDPKIGEHAVRASGGHALGHLRIGGVMQRDRGPVPLPSSGAVNRLRAISSALVSLSKPISLPSGPSCAAMAKLCRPIREWHRCKYLRA